MSFGLLPAQASAVPCEQSSYQAMRLIPSWRVSVSPLSLEILQILTFLFRNDQLSFTEHLVCTGDFVLMHYLILSEYRTHLRTRTNSRYLEVGRV
jgi:hypothetical protein